METFLLFSSAFTVFARVGIVCRQSLEKEITAILSTLDKIPNTGFAFELVGVSDGSYR